MKNYTIIDFLNDVISVMASVSILGFVVMAGVALWVIFHPQIQSILQLGWF